MKSKPLKYILLAIFAFPFLINAQTKVADDFTYEVNQIYPYISIDKDQLQKAKTLSDLHEKYKASWVREYISVEIVTTQQGKLKKATSKSDQLTAEQKSNMSIADAGTDIKVNIRYIPENNLRQNDPKTNNFTLAINPDRPAIYPGGTVALKQYLQKEAIDKLPDNSFAGYDLTAIKFTIGEEGEIVNAHVFDEVYPSYSNETVNDLLLKTIANMPCWQPAEYADGTKVQQEFVLTVGNMENCIIPLLGIQKEWWTSQE